MRYQDIVRFNTVRNFLVILPVLMIMGCASFTRRLEVSTVSKIQVQQTTRDEVEQLLGKPKETVLGANGVTVARYFFREFRRSSDVSYFERRYHPGDIRFRSLTLKYGKSNVVEQKLHDESMTPIYRTNAWFFAGPLLTPEKVAFMKRDFTNEGDLVGRFGEPSSRTFDSEGRPVLVWFHVQTRETRWSDPDVQRLQVLLDERRIVRDYVLVEHALSEFEPFTLH